MARILFLFLIFYFHHQGAGISPNKSDWAKIEEKLEALRKNDTFQDQWNQNHTDDTEPSHFPCHTYRSRKPPQTVHMLEPVDIAVLGAMGDSITAGNGIRANTVFGSYVEFRGYSWSIGGKDTFIDGVRTIPNIVKYYNPSVKGYATGTGHQDSEVAHLNVAHPGDVASKMPGQARMLIERMSEMDDVNFHEDWKMVTIFIGGNDICNYCDNKAYYSASHYVEHVAEALDILHERLPRTFVNVVAVMDITHIAGMSSGPVCSIVKWEVCKCAIIPSQKAEISALAHAYSRGVSELISSGRYDNRDDFTVVFQPFMEGNDVPRLPDGKQDFSYFAPDCFHFSQKGHNVAATMLWNALFEPVGSKPITTPYNVSLYCPKRGEYLATSKNSAVALLREPSPGKSATESRRGITSWQVGLIVLAIIAAAVIIGITLHRIRNHRNTITFQSGERQRLLIGPI